MILPHLAKLLGSESMDRARLLTSIASSLGLAAFKPFTSAVHKLIADGKRKRRYTEITEANANIAELNKLQESGFSDAVEALKILVSQRVEVLVGELQSLEAAERRWSVRRAGAVTKLRRLTLWFAPTTTREWLVHSSFYFWCLYFLWNVESAVSFGFHMLEHRSVGRPMHGHPMMFVFLQLGQLIYALADAFIAVYTHRYALFLRRRHETQVPFPVQQPQHIGWPLIFIGFAWLADVMSLFQYAAFFKRTMQDHGFSFFWHLSSPLRILLQVVCLVGIWLFLVRARKSRSRPPVRAEESAGYPPAQEIGA